MGARLASAAAINALPKLEKFHAARVALLVMCNTARDDDKCPKYFAGPEPIAHALGITSTGNARDVAVSKALKPLREKGFITLQLAPTRKNNAHWNICV